MVGILQQLLQGQQMFASQYASMQQDIKELKQNQASTSRSQGGLPGMPEPNPKDYAKAITLRSGKKLPGIEHNNVIIEDNDQIGEEAAPRDEQEAERSKKGNDKEVEKPSEPEKPYVPPPPYQPKLPYPERFKKQIADKARALFEKTLNETPLTMPLIEAFFMMPKLGKFLKDAILNKTKELQGMVVLSHECSAIIQRSSVPRKLSDPRSFTLPCAIGPLMFAGCLCDLGASVSLMPFSIARKLRYRVSKPARISLVLADRSVRLPVGMLEDLPVKIGGFEVPTDFVVLEMDEEPVDPLILGTPFLATAGAIIDVRGGIIELQLADELLEELNTDDPLQVALTKEQGDHGFLAEESEGYKLVLENAIELGPEARFLELEQSVPEVLDIRGSNTSQIAVNKVMAVGSKVEEQAEPCERLNPNLKEVVKKEILKLLEAGIIYPISDSRWVSPVHVVPKKGGMTVIKNDRDELIATRTITGHMMYPRDQEKTTFTCPYGTFAYRRMPFGLCNAPAIFQRCMMSIFSDLIEQKVEVFMDDFSVYGQFFSSCLSNQSQGIVLRHKVSEAGIEVDKAKMEVIVNLQAPNSVKGIRSFLRHAGFYRRFIKDFSRIARPFDKAVAPDWSLPFEVIKDASDYAVGAVLGQRKDRKLHVIYYASRTLDSAQEKYLMIKKDAKPRLLRWVLLLQEFDMEVLDKKGIENGAADHLSRLRVESDVPLDDSLPEEHLMVVKTYLEVEHGVEPPELDAYKRKRFFKEVQRYHWDELYLYVLNKDHLYRRCLAEEEMQLVLQECHGSAYGGHLGAFKTVPKVLQSGFWWPTMLRDAQVVVSSCDQCQSQGNISKRSEMPQNPIFGGGNF
ncbi:uncharacterized protein LOC112087279 [Eutrema salsugineum]|uniref:uncharacterized protein LOC112087279 n=1 Tax=Eutrema salsugineum TaxID=72664 RepID=UPI000CED3164|nr:uncharacterized protein LOC112087279 [Eutrema salsugineum]